MSKIIVDEIQTNTTNGNVRIIPNGTGVLEVNGSCTATTFSGSGASLTSIPAANITGTLPAIDGSNLTGVGGGGFEFVSKSEITSGNTAAYIDFTNLANDTLYRLVAKQIVCSHNLGYMQYQFKDTSDNLITGKINYTRHYGDGSSNAQGFTTQDAFYGAGISDTHKTSAFILEFFTKPSQVWFILNDTLTGGGKAFMQSWGSFDSSDTTTQVGGIRISDANGSGYPLHAGTQILLYKYKES